MHRTNCAAGPSARAPARGPRRGLVLSLLAVALVAVAGCGLFGGGGDGDTMPPPTPSGLVSSSGDAQIALQWSGVNADDLSGYNVYRAPSTLPSDTLSSLSPLNQEPLASPEFTDETVQNGTVYVYRVTAVDDSGNESDPSGATRVRAFAGPPDRP